MNGGTWSRTAPASRKEGWGSRGLVPLDTLLIAWRGQTAQQLLVKNSERSQE